MLIPAEYEFTLAFYLLAGDRTTLMPASVNSFTRCLRNILNNPRRRDIARLSTRTKKLRTCRHKAEEEKVQIDSFSFCGCCRVPFALIRK